MQSFREDAEELELQSRRWSKQKSQGILDNAGSQEQKQSKHITHETPSTSRITEKYIS